MIKRHQSILAINLFLCLVLATNIPLAIAISQLNVLASCCWQNADPSIDINFLVFTGLQCFLVSSVDTVVHVRHSG